MNTKHFVRNTYGELSAMENVLVGLVACLLIVYLFWTLVRPEHF